MTAPSGAQGAREPSECPDASLGSTIPHLLHDTFEELVRCRMPLSLLVRPRLGPRMHAGGARHTRPVWPQRSSGAHAAVSGSAAVGGGSVAEAILSGPHRAAIAASSVACAGRRRGPLRRAAQGPAADRPGGDGGGAEARAGRSGRLSGARRRRVCGAGALAASSCRCAATAVPGRCRAGRLRTLSVRVAAWLPGLGQRWACRHGGP